MDSKDRVGLTQLVGCLMAGRIDKEVNQETVVLVMYCCTIGSFLFQVTLLKYKEIVCILNR